MAQEIENRPDILSVSPPGSTPSNKTLLAHAAWSGPLPPPDALRGFDAVIPGSAERILKMAETEQNHRLDMEQRGLTAEISDTRRGQFLGALIAVVALGAAAYSAAIGAHWSVSVALVGIPLMGVVKAIIDRRSK